MTEETDEGIGWLTYLKVTAIMLVGAAAMVGVPIAIARAEPGGFGWATVFMLGIGGVALYAAFDELRQRQLMLNTPTSKVRSLAVGDVEVKGQARPADEPLTSPLTHTEACVYSLKIEEEHKSDEGSDWDTVLEFQRQVPFHVDDGTGEVLVEPEEADLDVAVEETVHVDDHDEPPAPIREFAQTEDGQEILETEIPREEGQDSGVSGKVTDVVESTIQSRAKKHLTESRPHDRRYKERVLGVGESAYVFGGAYPREEAASATNAENLVIREHRGTGEFIVSDKSEAQQAEEGLVNTAFLLAIGIGLVPGGVFALLRFLGLM